MIHALFDSAYTASTWIIPVILAVTLHEAAHAYVAFWCGDKTARNLGRTRINPLVHIDRFGTIILPSVLFLLKAPFIFGWAKPVPVNFAHLRNPRRDMIWVAVAGPATNIILAISAALLSHLIVLPPQSGVSEWLFANAHNAMIINVILAVFNMLPVPPLDGGRIIVGLLPSPLAGYWAALERFGLLIILGILFIPTLIGVVIGVPFDAFYTLIEPPVSWVYQGILYLTGWIE